ncbi:MAG: hypothetical protein CL504_04555 [Actinobacteria bacterium]|nr:hypothetical protein [Actinomycetota bacterium]
MRLKFLQFVIFVILGMALFGCETELKVKTVGVICGSGEGEMDCPDLDKGSAGGFGLRILTEALITNADESLIRWEEEPGAISYTVGLYSDSSCSIEVVSFRQAEAEKNIGILRDDQYYSCVWAHFPDREPVPADNNGVSIRVDRIAPVIDNSEAVSADITIGESLGLRVTDDTTMSFLWRQLEGPSQLTLDPVDAAETIITGTTVGLYQVELLVTDAAGNITVFAHEFNLHMTEEEKEASILPKKVLAESTPVMTLTDFSINSIVNGNQISNSSPTITWSASQGATSYDLLVCTNASCTTPIQSYLGSTGLSVPVTDLPEGSYYLCLTAYEGDFFSLAAPEVQFIVDTTPASVDSVYSTTANGTYKAGDIVDIIISFDSSVLVTGSPTLRLNTARFAGYASGSATSNLVFNYAIQAGDNTADLNYDSVTALVLGGGTIEDEAGNASIITLPVLSAAGSLGVAQDIVVDTTAPTSTLAGEPMGTNNISNLSVNVSGTEVTHYRYKVGVDATTNCALATGYSGEISVSTQITDGISAFGDGGIELCVIGRDSAGNWQAESAATRASWVRDSNVPTASLSGQPSSTSNVTTLSATVAGSTVTHYKYKLGLTTSTDCAATIGYSNETTIGTPISDNISSLADGSLTLCLLGRNSIGTWQSEASASTYSWTKDTLRPSVAISAAQDPGPTNASSLNLTVNFSKDVSGFDLTDVVVIGGAKSSLSGSGASYTVTITPLSAGLITADIASNLATDAAGNTNTSASQWSIVHDNTAPTATISGEPVDPSNTANLDVTVGGADVESYQYALVASSTTCAAANYNGSWIGVSTKITDAIASSEEKRLCVLGRDLAGNGESPASASEITWTNDAGRPTVTLSSIQDGAPTNADTLNLTAEFSEDVTGFSISDLVVINGTATNFNSVDGNTYTFDVISPSATVKVDIAANVVQDASNNDNEAASQWSIVYDNISPTANISSTQDPGPTNAQTINLTVQFSEPVLDFTVGDIVVVNGVAGNFSATDSDTYTFDITSPSGTVTANIAGSVAQDMAGNDNSAASQWSIDFDGTFPSVVITASQDPGPTNAETINLTAQFSKVVTGFVVSDIVVANGTIANFNPVDGDTYTFDITSPSGTVTADIAGSVAQDASTNPNTQALQWNIVYDTTPPTVTLSASQDPGPTNIETINLTAQFSEDVTGFTVGDITVANGVAGNFNAVDADTYTFDITASSGTVTADVNSSVTTDIARNSNLASSQWSIVYDGTQPSVVLTADKDPGPTNADTLTLTAQFSEPVTGFTSGDIVVTGGNLGNFNTIDGDTYTFEIVSPSGTVTANIGAGIAQDSSLNDNTAATQWSIVHDTTPPTVAITAAQDPGPTNDTRMNLTVEFSEDVNGFTLSDVDVANGVAENFNAVDANTYTFDIISPSGTVTADIAESVVQDAAGNSNSVASQWSVVFDSNRPTVNITALQDPGPTNASIINLTAEFSEDVIGFDMADISVANGVPANFNVIDGNTYTFDISSPTGTVTADIADAIVQDAAGNGNNSASQWSIVFDSSAPSVVLSSAQDAGPTNATTINMTAEFSEDVTGFAVGDLSVSGGTVINFSVVDGKTYTFDIVSLSGTVTADISGAAAQDSSGNDNTAASQWSIVFDDDQPTVSISATQDPGPTNATTINLTAQFSEAVSGFSLDDIVVANGVGSNFVAVAADTYTFDITSPSGTLTVDVLGSAAQDVAGNSNTAASQWSIDYDGAEPTVTITSSQDPGPTNSSIISLTAQFSEPVLGFGQEDIAVVNGSVANFLAVDGGTYTFDITSPSGSVTAQIAGGAVQDSAGNSNAEADQWTINYDATQPSVIISASQDPGPTSFTTLNLTAEFSESVTGFTQSDIVVVGGTLANFVAVDGDTYTFDLTSPSGTVTANIAGSLAQDASGNQNTAASQWSIVFDDSNPTVVISAAQDPGPTNSTTINLTAQFSKAVTGFVASDISVGNGTLTNFTAVDSDTYTFDITSPSGTVTANIAANVAQDAALNGNDPASQWSIAYDNTTPTVTISASQDPGPTNVSTISLTAQFSEAVTGFTGSDISVAGGNLANFSALDGDTYTFDITSPSGTVTANIVGGVALDGAGNGNTAASQWSILHDNTEPAVTITATQDPGPINSGPINLTAQFSEAVTGFTVGDISATNGSVSNFVAVDGDTYTFDITSPSETVTADINGSVAKDAAGNNNTAASQWSIVFDNTRPTVTITANQDPGPTNDSTINMTAQFSENVTGFLSGDITVSNGIVSNFAAVDGDTYTFDITPSTGTVTADIAGSVAQDAAGNVNSAASQWSITYDGTAPAVVITASQDPGPTNATTLNLTAQFSEPVLGFGSSDITVANGNISNFVAVDGDTYTFDITSPTATVTADIGASYAQDSAGNGNMAATQWSILFDNSPPVFSSLALINDSDHDFINIDEATNSTPLAGTLVASGYDSNGYLLIPAAATCNGAAGSFSGSIPNSNDENFSGEGAYKICVELSDNAGNYTYAETSTITLDTTAPTVPVVNNPPQYINADNVALTYSPGSDTYLRRHHVKLCTTSGCGTCLSEENETDNDGNATYTASLTSNTPYYVCMRAQDEARNNSAWQASSGTVTKDVTAPTVVITSAQDPGPTGEGTINLTAQFSETVTGFTQGDISAGNGSVANFFAVDGDTYTFDITPSTGGSVTVNIAGSAAQDVAGNNNSSASQWSINYVDGQDPATNLTVSTNVNQLDLGWDSPGGESGYLVARSNSAVTFTPVDGNACNSYAGTQGAHQVFCVTDGNTYNDENIGADTFYYGVFAFDSGNIYSTKLSGSGSPTFGITNGNFETGNTDGWTMSGTGNWSTQGSVVDAGSYSAESNEITDNQSSCMEQSLDLTSSGSDSAVSFRWKVGSESGYDFSVFYINGAAQNSRSGNLGWETKNYPLTKGASYTLKWCFEKDNSVSDNCDCMYLDEVSLAASILVAPSGLTLSSIDEGVNVSFGGNNAASGYLVARSTAPVTFRPEDGSSYSTGSQGADEIIHVAAGTSFNDTGLTNGTTYYYTAWSYDGSNNYSGGTSGSGVAMVANVTNLAASTADGQIDLTWSLTAGSAAGYLIVRESGSAPSFAPDNGTSYSTGSETGGEIVYVGGATSYSDTGLSNGVTYHYKAWARSSAFDYSLVADSTSGQPVSCPGVVYAGGCWITTPGNNSCANACAAIGQSYDFNVFNSFVGSPGNSTNCKNAINTLGFYTGSWSGSGGSSSSSSDVGCAWSGSSVRGQGGSGTSGTYSGFGSSYTQICPCN